MRVRGGSDHGGSGCVAARAVWGAGGTGGESSGRSLRRELGRTGKRSSIEQFQNGVRDLEGRLQGRGARRPPSVIFPATSCNLFPRAQIG
jgi:hypothetical protein